MNLCPCQSDFEGKHHVLPRNSNLEILYSQTTKSTISVISSLQFSKAYMNSVVQSIWRWSFILQSLSCSVNECIKIGDDNCDRNL